MGYRRIPRVGKCMRHPLDDVAGSAEGGHAMSICISPIMGIVYLLLAASVGACVGLFFGACFRGGGRWNSIITSVSASIASRLMKFKHVGHKFLPVYILSFWRNRYMKTWIDKETGIPYGKPDAVDEYLNMIFAIGVDCDGCYTVEKLKSCLSLIHI